MQEADGTRAPHTMEQQAKERDQLIAFLDFLGNHRSAISSALAGYAFGPDDPIEASFTSADGSPTTAGLVRHAALTGNWGPYTELVRLWVQRHAGSIALRVWTDRHATFRHSFLALMETVRPASANEILHGLETVLSHVSLLVCDVYTQHLAQPFDRQNQQFIGVVECLNDAVITKTLEGTITGWNAGARALYGYSPEEVFGRNVALLVPPDRLDEFKQIMQLLQRGEGVSNLETVRLTKDGRRVEVVLNTAPIRLDGGAVVGAFAVAHDVTEQRRTAEAFRVMVEAAPSGIVMVDESGIIRQVNTETERLFGYQREEIVGQSVDMLIPGRFMPQHSALRRAFAAEPSDRPMGVGRDLAGLRKDGSEFPVEVSLRPVRLSHGVLIIAAIADITLRKEAERDLLQRQKMEAIGRLAGGVAHDFNNLLTVMMGCSELLLADLPEDGSSHRGLVSEIQRAADSAATITGQLLTFSRKSVRAPKPLDLVSLLSGLRGMLQRLLGEAIQLVVKEGPAAAEVFVDAAQIEQLILNLTANAADAMPTGGQLTFSVGLAEPSAPGGGPAVPWSNSSFVCLSVEDTGSGLSEETLAHMFEPFFTTKPQGRGTGLGLATVHGVVEQSGGHITVESQPNTGTRFNVYLPRHRDVLEARQSANDESTSPAPTRHNETVLLVEDEDGVRAICQTVLQAAGYRVLTALNGQKAMDLILGHREAIDLLVTDVVMPEMSGGQLVRLCRTIRPNIKVLYMSGYTNDAVVRHGVFEAQEKFLQKPFTPQLLLNRVREALE